MIAARILAEHHIDGDNAIGGVCVSSDRCERDVRSALSDRRKPQRQAQRETACFHPLSSSFNETPSVGNNHYPKE